MSCGNLLENLHVVYFVEKYMLEKLDLYNIYVVYIEQY